MSASIYYADVILPLALRQTYTYAIPESIYQQTIPGKRVIVQFGAKRFYTAIVLSVHKNKPDAEDIKEISSVLDHSPVVNDIQLAFWKWMAEYYLCKLGEVMNAALPSGLKLESETQVIFNDSFSKYSDLSDQERSTLAVIEHQMKVSINELIKQTGRKGIMTVVQSLIDKGAVAVEEELEESLREKTETFVELNVELHNEEKLNEVLEKLKRGPKQHDMMIAYLKISEYQDEKIQKEVRKKDFLKQSEGTTAAYSALIKKSILIENKKPLISHSEDNDLKELSALSDFQQEAWTEIQAAFKEKDVLLLHGVTSSGKTELYFRLIKEAIDKGKQVLYLLPEIALTTQMVNRLQAVFGNKVGVYHSKYNDRERVGVWNDLLANKGCQIILGVRSSVFLPFSNLGLIIIDEEHETTYKQFDPAPRYHARDSAVMLAGMHKAKVIMGSATPSVESFYNAATKKYALVSINQRFGNISLPEVRVVDIIKSTKKRQMHSHFSKDLMDAIGEALKNDKQVILFQNRRGFSIFLQCSECGWIPKCKHCDVSLTYHKAIDRMVCHYCGYTTKVVITCGECKQDSMKMKGFGTEKVEDEIKSFFSEAKISRLDLDTARSRKQYSEILGDFESGDVDILIGTQMVTKGLDFDHVSLVGILNADNMLNFPDFRAFERSYQLMSQVAGRAGRKNDKGLVLIQTSQPEHVVIHQVKRHDYVAMFNAQLNERKEFSYPPYSRLIKLTLKHHKTDICYDAATKLAMYLKKHLGDCVLGPDVPVISRLQGWYLRNLLIKIDRAQSVSGMKKKIADGISILLSTPGFTNLVVQADVDPY